MLPANETAELPTVERVFIDPPPAESEEASPSAEEVRAHLDTAARVSLALAAIRATPSTTRPEAPTRRLGEDTVEAIEQRLDALLPADADAWRALVDAEVPAVTAALGPDEAMSPNQVRNRAANRLSIRHSDTRRRTLADLAKAAGEGPEVALRVLDTLAAERREVALPPTGPTPEEQALYAKEGTTGLLGTANYFHMASTLSQRENTAAINELVAIVGLPDTTSTDALLEVMAEGRTPYQRRRAEFLLRERLPQLRIAAYTAEREQDRQAARDALVRFEAIREGRVSADVRAAEARERDAWERLAVHARSLARTAAGWASMGIAHDQGLDAEKLDAWRAESARILAHLRAAWRAVRRG